MRVSCRRGELGYVRGAFIRLDGVPQMFAIRADSDDGWVDVVSHKEQPVDGQLPERRLHGHVEIELLP